MMVGGERSVVDRCFAPGEPDRTVVFGGELGEA